MEITGLEQERKETSVHRLPAGRRRGVESREFARVAIDRDLALDLIDEVEAVNGDRRGVWHFAGVEHDLEPAGHRVAADDERMDVVLTLHASLPRRETAVEGVLVAAKHREHRVESFERNLVDRLLARVGVAVGHEKPVEKLEQLPRHAEAAQALE